MYASLRLMHNFVSFLRLSLSLFVNAWPLLLPGWRITSTVGENHAESQIILYFSFRAKKSTLFRQGVILVIFIVKFKMRHFGVCQTL